ncbi:transcription factor bHLH68-like isoform X1 [Ananas comosus]|uniref:Transcription factor bHLH68-like isoform X1 n=2 Tax=Ananas comosus TaxID=4615 RepID=A0A6P5FB58_ANACO|nr:transcription factor bHLH68-like isoform X1 [Ananas comosus]
MNRLRSQAQDSPQQPSSSSSSAPPPPPSSSFSSLSSSSSSPSSCSSSSMYTHYTNQSNLPNTTLYRQDNQIFPKSWSQLLLDGLVEEKEEEEDDDDDRMISSSFAPHFQPKLVENWKDQVLYPPPNTNIVGPKQEGYESGFMYQNKTEDIQITMRAPFWSHALHASSINSCATTSLSSSSSSMLDISKSKPDSNNLPLEISSDQCNSTTGSALKKARVQISSVSQPSIKVRKEKLGDRITALHQLVSPFGKTDTASVLQEAIGYIRFLHHQIEALCLPHLVDGSTNSRQLEKDERNDVSHEVQFQDQDACDEPKKDLRSKGLCLVPISLILYVDRDNKANYWG